MEFPKTPLGKKLLAIREKAIKEGMKLFSEEEVLEEIKSRRSGNAGKESAEE